MQMHMLLKRILWPMSRRLVPAANVAEGTHPDGVKSFLADAAITETYVLGVIGTDVNHIAACGNDGIPEGIIESQISAAEITAGLQIPVRLLGASRGSVLMVASEAIDPTAVHFVCSAASGRVKGLPTANGTYYIVGKPLTAAAAAGDRIEVIPCVPVQRVVSG